ncbi:epoxide hydrolase [Aulographum hederae CBS 113979]|uniref:Epoxide hydrolase n=1 Tax=Aulographum hederae CBS 113979 TaxID=1176131 RepID=A0A6G1HA82_9PEZI|nr:epoxide hydrolase [Aulographum hederae CBS 113979]
MSNIKSYQIAVPEAKLQRLSQKLALTDLPDELDSSDWKHGASLTEITRLVDYWKTSFNWRAIEADLNKLTHFTADIPVEGFSTLNMHFLHQPSPRRNATPLLFVHGWPGNFLEATKLLPDLTNPSSPSAPAFHVVAPSCVNFGFSAGTTKPGFNVPQHAEACHNLMLALGYNQYVTQGGDMGYSITRLIAAKYPTSCRATHINMASPTEPTETSNPSLFTESQRTPPTASEKAHLARYESFLKTGMGYFILQATKPQTIAYSVTDSPVGLLAWMYEKMHDWSSSYPWSDDEVLTWVCIYLFSAAGPAASQRIYYEASQPLADGRMASEVVNGWVGGGVKVGIARVPGEFVLLPRVWSRGLGEVVFEREWEAGGHFAAWERPGEMVRDLREMFGRGGGAEGVVEGRGGY